MTTKIPHDSTLVTPAMMRRWQKEYDRLGKQIGEIEKRRTSLKMLLQAGTALTPVEAEPLPTNEPVRQKRPRGRPKRQPPSLGDSTWKETIKKIVITANRPMPYNEIKAEIMKTDLAARLERSEKGFYGAISRLADDGDLVRYKGHLISKPAYEKFVTNMKAGLVRDLKVPNIAHHSPMGEAIKEFMSTRPKGATVGNIVWELQKNPQFAQTIKRHKTHLYNVLKRLRDTDFLTKRTGRYYFVHLKTEEPSAAAEGPSQPAGGGDAPPADRAVPG